MPTIILMTGNARKKFEYERFFAPFNMKVEVRPHSPSQVPEWLAQKGIRMAIKDESNLWTPDHRSLDEGYSGPAVNICKVEAWICSQGQIVHRHYSGLVEGTVCQYTTHNLEKVFGWDRSFVPHGLGKSLHEMQDHGLKCSAREHALSSLSQEFLQFRKPKELNWDPIEVTGAVDLNASVASFVQRNLFFQALPPFLWNLVANAVNAGCHFRRATNRRIGNYWHPGLNSGIPFTPKKDPIQEITYLFHDLAGHHTMPDLIYGGQTDEVSRRVYLISRLMSEAWSLVIADMLFVDHLAKRYSYNWDKRKIWPLYDENRGLSVTELLWRMTRYVCLGDRTVFENTRAFSNFQDKYRGYFTADWKWSVANWEAMLQRRDTHFRWVQMVGEETFQDLGLETLSSCVKTLGVTEDTSLEGIVQAVFNYHLPKVLACEIDALEIDFHSAGKNAVQRYFLGQSMAYARHYPVVPTLSGLTHLLTSEPDPVVGRIVFDTYLGMLEDLRVISPDDRRVYTEVFPHFDPVFVSYDNDDGTIAEVLHDLRVFQ